MGRDKHGSRSGRYVGSFLQLFDWNAKSRKKLFSSKSDYSPEQRKQGKKSKENFPSTRIHLDEDEGFRARLSFKGGSDYSCASSITDDDVYGMKAPGVVARLMGLDSLPAPNTLEPYAIPFSETQSLRDASFRRKDLDLYPHHQIMNSSPLLDKMGSPPRKALDMKPQKFPNRPIEKFQTEILPPKSVKTIPITHHKLLSPIRTPIFVPSQDAAHIMRAAAKIIEPGPQETSRRRMSLSGSCSVPFKVQELKEQLEAAHRPSKATETSERPVESKAAKHLRGQLMDKRSNGSVDITSFRVSASRDENSDVVKNKGKSISLAIQAKVNVQKRERLSSSSRNLGGPEEEDDTKSNQSFKSQPNSPKTTNRKPSTSSVLRHNNQKQNCSTYRGNPPSRPSVTSSTGKKAVSDDISNGRRRSSVGDSGTYRTAPRKSRLQARDNSDKDFPYPGVRNVPRKKRSLESNVANKKHEKQPSCDTVSDVVSFTFSAPITRSLPGSESSRWLGEKSCNLFTDDRGKKLLCSDNKMLSLPGLNVIGSDALSVLLEQKLKELTSNFETSNRNFHEMGMGYAESPTGEACGKKAKQDLRINATESEIYSSLSSSEPEQFRRHYNFEVVEAIDEYNSIKAVTKQWNDCHLPSPVSILDHSVLTESCNSSESIPSSSVQERKACSSVHAPEVLGSSSSKKRDIKETEIDTSDSASSISSQIGSAKDPMKPTPWELVYIQNILHNVEIMFKNYALDQTQGIVKPDLFDQMERRQRFKRREDASRFERKVLFDSVRECLDLKCQRFVGGGFELWAKGIATVKRKERLAEEVYKEIQGWKALGKSMVDELVDKDMSSKYGRWVEFEVDEVMVGVDIEAEIFDSLVMEIVAHVL